MKPSHNGIYSALQEEYLTTRDRGILGEMYGVAREASKNYINKYCRKKGILLDRIDEMSHDSAVYVIDQYLRKPGFKVLRISAYIHFAVMKTLFRNKDTETREVSYEERAD
jgi:hypothetical protein